MTNHLGPVSVLGVAFSLLALSGCVSQQTHRMALKAAEDFKQSFESLHAYQLELESRNRDLEARLAKANVEGAEGQAVLQEASALRGEYQRRMKALEAHFGGTEGWSAGDVEIFSTPAGEVYRIKDAILFDSGSSKIKENGRKLIREVASQLQVEGKRLRVEGHTDSDPVVRHKVEFPYGNLQLSTARALEVANILITECKIPGRQVSVAGFGEFQPLAANDSEANKRRNRRVEIVVLGSGSSAR